MAKKTMTPYEDITKFGKVVIKHSVCGRWWFCAVDLPEDRRSINRKIGKGYRQGDIIEFVPPGIPAPDVVGCDCFREAQP